MAGLSEGLLKSAVAAILKSDKFEVTKAELAADGEGIHFNARSKSGQVRVTGVFSDPQQKLELEEPENDDVEDEAIDPDTEN